MVIDYSDKGLINYCCGELESLADVCALWTCVVGAVLWVHVLS